MSVLSDEIDNDPTGKGYAGLIANQPGRVCDLLNAPTETKVKARMITARGILSDYPGGPAAAAVVLDKLEAATETIPALKWAFGFLKTPEGIDIGHPATQGMIGQLSPSIITLEEAANLKALAIQPASRAEVLGLPRVTEAMLRGE